VAIPQEDVQECPILSEREGAGRSIGAGALELEKLPAPVLVLGRIPFPRGRNSLGGIIFMALPRRWNIADGGIYFAGAKKEQSQF
jgi:hypothetical protein